MCINLFSSQTAYKCVVQRLFKKLIKYNTNFNSGIIMVFPIVVDIRKIVFCEYLRCYNIYISCTLCVMPGNKQAIATEDFLVNMLHCHISYVGAEEEYIWRTMGRV